MDGLFMEHGPFRLQGDKLGGNPYAWTSDAAVIYGKSMHFDPKQVDQPVGTGFSYSGKKQLDRAIDEAAAHFYIFIQKFYELFPQYQKANVCICVNNSRSCI